MSASDPLNIQQDPVLLLTMVVDGMWGLGIRERRTELFQSKFALHMQEKFIFHSLPQKDVRSSYMPFKNKILLFQIQTHSFLFSFFH